MASGFGGSSIGVDDLGGPFALDLLVVDEVGFAAMPSFSRTRAEAVLRASRRPTMRCRPRSVEAEAEHFGRLRGRSRGRGGSGLQDVADLALAVLLAGPDQDAVADEFAGVAQGDGEVDGVAFVQEGDAGDLVFEEGAYGVEVAGFPVEVAGDVGPGLVGVQGVEVVGGEGAQQEAVGEDRVVRFEHRGSVENPASGARDIFGRAGDRAGGRAAGRLRAAAGVRRAGRGSVGAGEVEDDDAADDEEDAADFERGEGSRPGRRRR